MPGSLAEAGNEVSDMNEKTIKEIVVISLTLMLALAFLCGSVKSCVILFIFVLVAAWIPTE